MRQRHSRCPSTLHQSASCISEFEPSTLHSKPSEAIKERFLKRESFASSSRGRCRLIFGLVDRGQDTCSGDPSLCDPRTIRPPVQVSWHERLNEPSAKLMRGLTASGCILLIAGRPRALVLCARLPQPDATRDQRQ